MNIFRKKEPIEQDVIKRKFRTIAELTYDLSKTDAETLVNAVKSMHEAWTCLEKVRTNKERAFEKISKKVDKSLNDGGLDDIDVIEKTLEKEKK